MAALSAQSAQDPRVLLGVMANPANPRLRQQQREWGRLFPGQSAVDVRFVLGAPPRLQRSPALSRQACPAPARPEMRPRGRSRRV